MAEHELLLGYVRLLLLLYVHPIRHAWKKTKEWKRTPSTQYGDTRRQYSDYTKIILIVINTITDRQQNVRETAEGTGVYSDACYINLAENLGMQLVSVEIYAKGLD
jgi:predicted nucleic acid-binding protein